KAAQLRRGRNVSFYQSGRYLKTTDHVVKSVAGIIRGQVGGGIDGEAKDLMDGIGIFRPVESVNTRWRKALSFSCGAIEFGFERDGQSFICRRFWSRHTLRRHHTGAKLSDDLFPRFCVLRNMSRIYLFEREAT